MGHIVNIRGYKMSTEWSLKKFTLHLKVKSFNVTLNVFKL